MRAMVVRYPHAALDPAQVADPHPGLREVLIRVSTCGVCRTALHVVDGELAKPKRSLVSGDEIVGRIVSTGPQADRFRPGDRVGVP
jgi:propanol-preferring alcohol dehydrogenase